MSPPGGEEEYQVIQPTLTPSPSAPQQDQDEQDHEERLRPLPVWIVPAAVSQVDKRRT